LSTLTALVLRDLLLTANPTPSVVRQLIPCAFATSTLQIANVNRVDLYNARRKLAPLLLALSSSGLRKTTMSFSSTLLAFSLFIVHKRGGRLSSRIILVSEELMPTLVGFSTFAALPEEEISQKISRRVLSGDQGMLVWWSIGEGVHVEPHSHANEQIVWMLRGKMEFRLGSEQRICGPGDVVVIPGGIEHEAWFRENTEVIDFFAPRREDFLLGGKPAYMSGGEASGDGA
jgi:unsaturated pyranuronate lyase